MVCKSHKLLILLVVLIAPRGNDGRQQYALPIIGAGLTALRTAAPRIASLFRSQAGKVTGGGQGIAGKYTPAPLTTMEKIRGFFQTAPAGKYMLQELLKVN